MSKTRKEQIKELFPKEPKFRLKQIDVALFDPKITSWNDISSLPNKMREVMNEQVPFMSLVNPEIHASSNKETYKAIVEVDGGSKIETVLMKNKRGYWSICVSSQVGCAMACAFCATGKMGLIKNLNSDEIVDQYRLWQTFLSKTPGMEQLISNIVYMGMGEPLSNYETVKESLNVILENTEIGNTKITVSTVGVLPRLEQILTDEEWPHVRMAVSLHSADKETREKIVPSSYNDFLEKLADWSKKYLAKFGNRRHHLTFEYVMLKGVNDSPLDAKKLAVYVNRIGNIRINLIPYNFTDSDFTSSSDYEIAEFKDMLEKHGAKFTVRKTQGEDIAAACGQLVKESKK
jgi:23S rRNA (adenine2503-C2)-methyltransferase